MVREGMEITRREFNEKLAKIREGLAKYTADELFEGESKRFPKDTDLFLFRHNCYGAGQYSGPDIWLYDRFGGGIQSQRMLDSTLDEKLNDGEQFWVVPADVHF